MAALAAPARSEFGAAQIHGHLASRRQRPRRAGQISRQAQFTGEHVERAQGHEAQADGGQALRNISHAVDNFVGGAIAAGGDDGGEPLTHGLGCQLAGLAGPAGAAHDGIRAKGIEP